MAGLLVQSLRIQSPVYWTLPTVVFGSRDGPWSGLSPVDVSQVGKQNIRCVLPNLEAHWLLGLVGFIQSLHDCMHILHAPHGRNLLHNFNHLLKEQIHHGT